MSGFICSHYHINAIVRYVRANLHSFAVRGRVLGSPYKHVFVRFDEDAQKLGQFLHHANVASVNARSGDTSLAQTFSYSGSAAVVDSVSFIKAVNCLAYQSCQVENWTQTDAYVVTSNLIAAGCQDLPGYADAPWELERPDDGVAL